MKEDRQIWNDFRCGEEYSLSYIYQQNIDFLFYYGKRFSKSDDFVLDNIQDLFYDLIRARKSLGETDHIRLYLAKSLRRKLIRELEKKKIEIECDADYRFDPEIVFSVEEEMVREENQTKNYQLIREGMQKLSSKQREILYYKFDCGFDYDQICELMSISYSAARQLVSRAVVSMKGYLSDFDLVLLLAISKLKK
jgi:RNA polymerase sigma factor (sigma-70 family)